MKIRREVGIYMVTQIIKRDGRKVEYDSDKIVIAISQANKEVGGKDKISRANIEFITKYISYFVLPVLIIAVYKTFDSLGVIWGYISSFLKLLLPIFFAFN